MKKIFSVSISLLLVLQSYSPFIPYAFAQSISTPSATESLINSLSPSATDSADQSNPSPSFSDPQQLSANLKIVPPVFVLGLSKANFQAKEQVEVVIKNTSNKAFSLIVQDERDANYTPNTTQANVNGDTIFTIYPSANLRPGRYKIKVLDTSTNQVISEQEFTWGVLAINTDKSIYLPNETAKIAMAVLDETGNMVCSAKVTLDIASPFGTNTHLSTDDGSIKVNPDCRMHSYTLNPDYEASYQTSDIGRYTTTLTATTSNGSYTTKDRFEVRSYVAFDIQRETATRIYPPDKYPVKMKIHANEAFTGKIVESVPSDFQISNLQQEGVIGYAQENAVQDNLGADKNYGIPHLNMPFNGNYPVTLGFGQEIDDPKDKDVYKKSGLDGHDGIDFALPQGSPVLAVDSGKVILAEENWIYGTSIVIQHNWGRTYYGHLSKLEVSVGGNVSSGTEIGLSGSTGLATGPHLHFGLKPNDNDIDNLYFGKIDPAPYLGISSEDPALSVSDYPIATKALVWNVEIEKGADFTIGYQYKAPNKSPNFYTIGPLQFISSQVKAEKPAKFDVNINPFVLGAATSSGILISTSSADLTSTDSASLTPQSESNQNGKDRVVFQEIRKWQLAIDAATTIIITTSYTDSCGANCWTVPSNWNSSNNTVEVIGPGGNGATSVSVPGGGGGGGAYSKVTSLTLTPGGVASFQIGTGGSATATWFSASGTVNAGAGANASGRTQGNGGTVGAGTGFSGGNGGTGGNLAGAGGGGGGGAAGPNGAGYVGGSGIATGATGGGGGGGNGGGTGTNGAAPTNVNGANGGDGNGGTGHGVGGAGAGGGGTAGTGGGGAGGAGTTAAGGAFAGGTGAAGIDLAAGADGTGGGGGGGGGNTRTTSTGNNGGGGGMTTIDSGAGGGGGGDCTDTGCTEGAGRTGANGFIVITYTPSGPTLDQLMRHGKWFNAGVEQPFTF